MDLTNYYKLNFALKQHHQWSLAEIESMIPWEREIYVMLLEQFIKDHNDKIRAMQNEQ